MNTKFAKLSMEDRMSLFKDFLIHNGVPSNYSAYISALKNAKNTFFFQSVNGCNFYEINSLAQIDKVESALSEKCNATNDEAHKQEHHHWSDLRSYVRKYKAFFISYVGEDSIPEEVEEKPEPEAKFCERDLHRLMANYLHSKNIFPKTIFHEKSNKSDQAQKWVHPDMIGTQFVAPENDCAKVLMRAINPSDTIRISSYELKIEIQNDYQLKQYFFQALSNSNWANLGYLVAYRISPDLYDEMERLNQAYGIGVIQLGKTPQETKILYPAKDKALDFKTMSKLANINTDFSSHIGKVNRILTATDSDNEKLWIKSLRDDCDKGFANEEENIGYCKKLGIV